MVFSNDILMSCAIDVAINFRLPFRRPCCTCRRWTPCRRTWPNLEFERPCQGFSRFLPYLTYSFERLNSRRTNAKHPPVHLPNRSNCHQKIVRKSSKNGCLAQSWRQIYPRASWEHSGTAQECPRATWERPRSVPGASWERPGASPARS